MGKSCVLAPDSSSRHARHRALRLELVHIGLGKRKGTSGFGKCVSRPLPRAQRAGWAPSGGVGPLQLISGETSRQ
eukprot:9487981-Pyramimonas_sp.AAC.1